jgi:hypothetical protein
MNPITARIIKGNNNFIDLSNILSANSLLSEENIAIFTKQIDVPVIPILPNIIFNANTLLAMKYTIDG